MDLVKITILENHRVQTGSVAPLAISIDGQNGVDELAFEVPAGMEDWAWRVEIEQGGKKTWRLLDAGNVWAIRAGEVAEGYAKMQLVGSRTSGEDAEVWKSREFDVNVLPAINAAEAMEPGEASEFDRIAAEVKGDADRADAAAIRAEDAAAGAENIVNMAINDIEAEGQKQAAAVASSGTQALEAIGQVEQTAIAQVQAAGTTQVGAVEDAGDGKLVEIDAANAHAPQINEETGKWQVWDAQTGAYVDTDTDAQGPQGETGATGPQGPAGADGIGLPVATAEDAGKVPVVNAAGTGYEFRDAPVDAYTKLESDGRYAPIAAAIRPTVSGNPISISDGVKWPLQGLKIYGKSTQDGTPSLDNPVPIMSAGDSGSIALTVSDGADSSQNFTISTPNGLPGIPVDSGGNYTDSDGQQWCCDQIDLEKGLYIQKCYKIIFNGSENWVYIFNNKAQRQSFVFTVPHQTISESNSAISSTLIRSPWGYNAPSGNNTISFGSNFYSLHCSTDLFENVESWKTYLSGQNMTVYYVMADAIESPLTAEQLAAYAALHTYDSATTISTAEDVAGLEVRYVANAEKYIDNKLAAINEAILEVTQE